MNQAIQFPDRENWLINEELIIFPVMVNGMLFDCQITKQELEARFGENESDTLQLFQQNRWEIEDEFEELIANNELSTLYPAYSLSMEG